MSHPFLSIIIPAYNEAERLPLTLIDLDKHLSEEDYSYEILVVCDPSTDNTEEIVRRFGTVIKNLKLLTNPGERGKGAAAKIGALAASGNWRLIMDADNFISISQLKKMLPFLSPNHEYDILTASRGIKGTRINPSYPQARALSEYLLNLFIRAVLRIKVKDSILGFHCFSAAAAEKIFPALKIKRWSFSQESFTLAQKFGFKVKEIPVEAQYKTGSHFKMFDYLQMIWETVKIRWWLTTGRYS